MNWSSNYNQFPKLGSSRIVVANFLRRYADYALFLIPVSLAVALSLSIGPNETVNDSALKEQAIELISTGQSPVSVDAGVDDLKIWQEVSSNDTDTSTSSSVEIPLENSVSELTDLRPEPGLRVSEDTSDFQQHAVTEENPEFIIPDQESPELKVATVHEESVGEYDQTVAEKEFQLETPQVDFSLINSVSQLNGLVREPVFRASEDSTESYPNSVAENISEHAITDQEAPVQKVAIVNREFAGKHDPTVLENNFRMETPPTDSTPTLPEDSEVNWSTTMSAQADALSNVSNENITGGIDIPSWSSALELAEKKPESAPQDPQESSESHKITVAEKIYEHTITDHVAPAQTVAMVDRESTEQHDLRVPEKDLRVEALLTDSVPTLPESSEVNWSTTTSAQADALSNVGNESITGGVDIPSGSSALELAEKKPEPTLQVSKQSSESYQNSVADDVAEHILTDQEESAPKVALIDREFVAELDPTVLENNFRMETPPTNSTLTLPEGSEVNWSTTTSTQADALSNITTESITGGVDIPSGSSALELAEKKPEPTLQISKVASESYQISVADDVAEHILTDQEESAPKVALIDREFVEGSDQTVPENDVQPERSPIAPALFSAGIMELDSSMKISSQDDSLRHFTSESITGDVQIPPMNSASEMAEKKPEPVLQVTEEMSESHRKSVTDAISEFTVEVEEAPALKIAMVDRELVVGDDQMKPQFDLQRETVPIESAVNFAQDLVLDWSTAIPKRNDESPETISESVYKNIVKPLEGINSELAEKKPEPALQVSEDFSESLQNTAVDEKSELTVADLEVPKQKLAMIDRESVEVPDQTAPENELQLETPPVDSALILPEGLELVWSTTVFKRNDTLSKVLRNNGIKLKTMYQLLDVPGTDMLKVVYPKDQLTIARGGGGELVGIEFRREKKGVLMFVFADDDVELIDPAVAENAGSLRNIFDKQHRVAMQEKQESFVNTVAAVKEQELKWHEVTVRKGDTLGRIFGRLGISGALEVAHAPSGNWLSSGLMPKQEIRIATRADDTFAMIEVFDFKSERIRMVIADGEDYTVGFRKMQPEIREYQACATVKNNLYSAAKSAKIPFTAIDEFADIFASRIDFSRQLQKGDRYCMIYERKFVKERIVGRVGIVAASLEQQNHKTQAFRVTDEIGDTRYYDQYGENMLGHFLRAPVKSARVTSVFSNNRFHPILKKYRKHQGVDYGAARNTPIISTADGIVARRANNPSGYGKVIVIQHGSKYQTLYAHMNKFAKNTSTGSYVKRGQVIGYVGSSGQSTGDHVHYEFRVNGVHRDPLNYPMPKGKPVPAELREEFDRKVAILSPRLQGIDQTIVVAVSSNPQQ